MMKARYGAVVSLALCATLSVADDNPQLESRVRALEARVEQTQKPVASANAFNPAISITLGGTYGQFKRSPEEYAIPGFALDEEAGPGTRGLSLGESELGISANVDDLFFGNVIASIAPEGGMNVEEGYVQTTALPGGFNVKFGRFFSAIGYLNEQHAHVWDFVDVPLPYRAMLGNQYNDDGVQLRWLAPTEQFIELGAEGYRGAHFPAGGAANQGHGTYTVFVHTGGDVGDSHSWRVGLSHLRAKAAARLSGDTPDVFTGDSRIGIADLEWKWSPHGNARETNLKLQMELLRRRERGTVNTVNYAGTQTGGYLQAVYQFMPRWRVGVRHDRVRASDPGVDFSDTALDPNGISPHRSSVMLDFSNSEFSRFRLQFNHDNSQQRADRQWYLQYIMSIGAHGAHMF